MEAELKVALLVKQRVSIKGKFTQLVAFFQAVDGLKLLDSVVRQEGSLEPGAVVETLN